MKEKKPELIYGKKKPLIVTNDFFCVLNIFIQKQTKTLLY